jgi:hypothetical protein
VKSRTQAMVTLKTIIINAPAALRQALDKMTPTRLVALSRNLPHDWQEQWRLVGFAPA